MPTVAEKRRTFRALHESGCFVLPNPWDIGSARYLQGAGFKALATTSSGAAWSLGYADGAVPLDAMLAHIASLAAVSDLPLNADFLNGFATEPEGVARNVARCVQTGTAGLSIEDSTGETREPLYDFVLAVERVAAARRAIDANGGDTLLVARSECFLTGHPQPLKEAIKRLSAFVEAGADCLYAPGVAGRSDIAEIVRAVAPKPVNVLTRGPEWLNLSELAALGVRRVSVGGAMARMAWAGLRAAAKAIGGNGDFSVFKDAAPGGELNGFFAEDAARRTP